VFNPFLLFQRSRIAWGCVLVLSLGLLGAAYLLEYGFGLAPCALCLLQRYVLEMIAVLACLAFLQNPQRIGTRFYVLLLLVFNSLGILLSARHLWVQYGPTPDTIMPCTAELQTLLQFKPLTQALADVLRNTHDCARIDTLFGLPLSAWSMLSFILLIAMALWTCTASAKNTSQR
jgi:protein dithiol:quinone oxidoreductase